MKEEFQMGTVPLGGARASLVLSGWDGSWDVSVNVYVY